MCANYKEIDWETEKIWEAMATAQNFSGSARKISIRTYVGARENPQYHAMICAMKEMVPKLSPKVLPYFFGEPEYLFIEQVNRRGMGVEDIIDWLLAGDIHFIICHIHQGFASHGKVLDMVQVKEQLKRLWFHPGFPRGIKLTCPVLTQDKRGYLDALGVGTLTNFTKFIYLRDLGDFSQEVIADLRMFCETHTENIGFVVKAPYTTNCSYIRFLTTFEDVLNALQNACRDLYGSIPYVIVQPKMFNRREHKVVCWNGEPIFLCSFSNAGGAVSSGGINQSFSPYPHTELFDFVRTAVQHAKKQLPELLSEGLFRVDVFKRVDGSLVVNEFESLEAGFPCLRQNFEYKTFAFLRMYWSIELVDSVNDLSLQY